jgi:hypothetical protein
MWLFVIPVFVLASLTFAGGIASNSDQQPQPPQQQAPTTQAAPDGGQK